MLFSLFQLFFDFDTILFVQSVFMQCVCLFSWNLQANQKINSIVFILFTVSYYLLSKFNIIFNVREYQAEQCIVKMSSASTMRFVSLKVEWNPIRWICFCSSVNRVKKKKLETKELSLFDYSFNMRWCANKWRYFFGFSSAVRF